MTVSRKWAVVDPAVGRRIREAREAAGVSQRQACRPTMYTAAALSRIENGQRQPSLAFLRALAPQLECSVAWLETGEELVDVRLPLAVAQRLHDGLPISFEDLDAMLMYRLGVAIGAPAEEPVIGLA